MVDEYREALRSYRNIDTQAAAYSLGWKMAAMIEKRLGRDRLVGANQLAINLAVLRLACP